MPLTNSNKPSLRALEHKRTIRTCEKYAHDRFIADKTAEGSLKATAKINTTEKKIYSNETIMSIPLTNRDEYAHDSFITIKTQIYSNEKS